MAFQLIQHEGEPFNSWSSDQIYFGKEPVDGRTLHVPNVNDSVTDWKVGVYRVASVSTDNIPTLELMIRFSQRPSDDLDSDSLITASTNYQPSAAVKVYYDDSVDPATLTIDGTYIIKGSEPTKCALFLGTDTDKETGKVISELRDADNKVISKEIPLLPVDANSPNSKRPKVFHTSHPLKKNEVVTLVTYTPSGGVYAKQPFGLIPSSSMRAAAATGKFLVGISIDSELLSKTDDTLIVHNANEPFSTSLIKGVLHYNDGSKTNVNIDGNKCKLHGVGRFDSSRLGKPSNVVISYYPSPNEPFVNGSGGRNKHLSKTYKLVNTTKDTKYSLKVYAVPKFVSDLAGYTFKWRLTNVEGDIDIDVTDDIEIKLPDGSDLKPNDYGNKQQLTLAVKMNDVSPVLYKDHIHTQKIDLTLAIPGTNGFSPWLVDYIGKGLGLYGKDLHASATNVNGGKIKVNNQTESLQAFLTKMYLSASPLYDASKVDAPPTPTHFELEYGDTRTRHPVSDFEKVLSKPNGAPDFADNDTLNILWLHVTSNGDRILAMSPMVIKLDL